MGRIVARWMVSKGARHLALLSRHGLVAGDAKTAEFVGELEGAGAQVYCPPCDVADADSLREALRHCREERGMPLVRGCIQAAMVLRDGVFENMSHAEWLAPLRPKVDGSWNLHEQLPRGLDFFILFSSVAGIFGSQAQTNYAAGNAFQDELARHRVAELGERALSVNLSLVLDDGFAVAHPDLAQQFLLTKHVVDMSQTDMLGLLDHVCDPDYPRRQQQHPPRYQIVMGLGLPSEALARGIDPPGWMHEPMFANLHQLQGDGDGDAGPGSGDADADAAGGQASADGTGHRRGGADLLTRARGASRPAEAARVVTDALVDKLCRVLARPPGSFDRDQPLHVYGVDSLVAVELRNWLLQNFKVEVAVFEIVGGSTCETLGRGVAEKVLGEV